MFLSLFPLRKRLFLLLFASFFFLNACSQPSSLLNIGNSHHLTWTAAIGRYASIPVVDNGMVYIGSNNLYAFDAATGQQKWTAPTGDDTNSPIVANGVVYVTTENSKLYAFDAATGQQKWAVQAPNSQQITVANGVIYIPNDQLYAFDTTTGQQKWAMPIPGHSIEGLAAANGMVYVNSLNSKLYAFDATTRQQKWTAPSDGLSTPVVDNGIVYLGSSKLYAFDATTGQQKWTAPTPNFGPDEIVAANNVVYAHANGKLYAFDTTTGQQKWTASSSGMRDPVVANGMVYMIYSTDTTHKIYAFDVATGQQKWTISSDDAMTGSLVVANGMGYTRTGRTSLSAFSF